MLRSMDVPVRSHSSQLSDEQVARLRARWEREKRARQEKPAAAPARRRRGTAAAAAAAPVAPAPAPEAAPEQLARRRRRVVAARPRTLPPPRRVTAAQEAEAAATAATHANTSPPSRASRKSCSSRIPRPKRPRVRPIEEARITSYSSPPTPARPSAPRAPETNTYSRSRRRDHRAARRRRRVRPTATGSVRAPSFPDRRVRKPASAGGYPPRPIRVRCSGRCTAASSAGSGLAPRRDDKRGGKRKKGKRGSVDQEAVTANISKTMAAMRGAPARRGSRRSDEPSYREEVEAQRVAEVEREKTIVRVNEFITVSELGADPQGAAHADRRPSRSRISG